ncbi:hypothetical protein [Macrococcus animalis]|uniref:hypothetical protein n=1 Tax=Macrococcus animalis TaxID=3395467 RepID=UPI0039BDC182
MQLNINDLNLTQLYLNQRKVNEVSLWLDIDTIRSTKVTVIHYNDKYYIVDGHTRCYVAYIMGIAEVPIEIYDLDVNSVEMNLYIKCMKWCKQSDIKHISDLSTRIVTESSFNKLWINKCKTEMELIDGI